ncbi:hypothetical protein [Escherichia phage vB-Eco-KMB25]|nr:hypothetical protein [Escherichia phage vB-Eco-KMB25]
MDRSRFTILPLTMIGYPPLLLDAEILASLAYASSVIFD